MSDRENAFKPLFVLEARQDSWLLDQPILPAWSYISHIMSAHYSTEPAPTAAATLNTTFGPLHISLFANQTPLACRNFLQHCMDDYYAGTIFHRVDPDFVVQGGDPTGTGSGGTSIYEYPEFEYDPDARDPNEKVVLRDELHSRLRYTRRGLLGMAKGEDGTYGSQFFITLANTERELNGQCTMFGRIEGDSIFNVLKIAEAERIEGTERPVYPVKVTSCEVGELGPLAGKVVKRQLTAQPSKEETKPAAGKKKKKPKGGKALLSFGGEEGEEEIPVRPAKPKFNPKLVKDTDLPMNDAPQQPTAQGPLETQTKKRPRSPSPNRSSAEHKKEEPKSPEPAAQLPLPDPESPERSPEPDVPPAKASKLERTNAEIENLMSSMRRNVTTGPVDTGPKKSALEAMIPETSIRGRRRPPPGGGGGSGTNGTTGPRNAAEKETLNIFNAFKAKLESADSQPQRTAEQTQSQRGNKNKDIEEEPDDDEAKLCDLHFIANCKSCQSWNDPDNTGTGDAEEDTDDLGWLSHKLEFGKDVLGKDLKWKQEHPDDVDSLMVIDPREREKEIVGGKKKGFARDRERERKMEKARDLEWDRKK